MKYSDFSIYVRPEAQGAPEFLVERAVRDSAIEFCTRTDVYMAEPEFITIVEGVNEYSVTIPVGTELNRVIDVFDNRVALKPVAYQELLHRLGDETETGTPKYYSSRDNAEVFFAPIPGEANSFRVLYSLKPSSASTSIADTVGKEHRETIAHGALYRLQMMAGHAFSAPGAAQNNKVLFDRAVGRVVRQTRYGFVGGALTAKVREFI
tara:strand:+ start:111 stop:734 length:624 start_codon:yes stop_codon:yes gene_type:complete